MAGVPLALAGVPLALAVVPALAGRPPPARATRRISLCRRGSKSWARPAKCRCTSTARSPRCLSTKPRRSRSSVARITPRVIRAQSYFGWRARVLTTMSKVTTGWTLPLGSRMGCLATSRSAARAWPLAVYKLRVRSHGAMVSGGLPRASRTSHRACCIRPPRPATSRLQQAGAGTAACPSPPASSRRARTRWR